MSMLGTKPSMTPVRLGLTKKFRRKTDADGGDQGDDERLDIAEPLVLQVKHGQHVRAHDHATPDQRNAEEKLKPDRRADHLRQVARRNGDLAQNPQKPDHRHRIMVPAGLGQVPSRGHAQLDAQVLEQDRHEVGNQDDAQEQEAEFRAARKSVAQLPGSM